MAFCANCGTQMEDGVKFCPSCGTPAGGAAPAKVKAGNIIKCPSCGASVPSMTAVCPDCGHEFRNVSAGGKIKEFFEKVKELETESASLYAADNDQYEAKDEELHSYVLGYPIPNTKEDIFEFIMFCSARAKAKEWTDGYNYWGDKCIQAYQRAEIVMASDKEMLAKLAKALRDKGVPVTEEDKKAAETAKKKNARKKTSKNILIAVIVIAGFACFFGLPIALGKSAEKETRRLTRTVVEVERLIEEKDWAGAYEKAAEIEWRYYPKAKDEKKHVAEWEEKRQELLSEIEAGKAAGKKAKDDE